MIIKDLIKIIKQGDIDAIKKIKKEVAKAETGKHGKEWKEFVKEAMAEFKKAKDVKLQIAINSTLGWHLTFFLGYELREYYSDFILKNIQHENGQIRQQSVKMGDSFIKDVADSDKNKKRNDYVVDFIKKIIKLIEEYKIKDSELIEREKPCVYKSLMFLLEEIARPKYIQKKLKNAGILEKTFGYLNGFYDQYYEEETEDDDFEFNQKDAYYDAMDMLCEGRVKSAVKILLRAISSDENNVELYVGLAAAFDMLEDDVSFEEVVERGYEKLKEKFSEWPKEMFWGYMENRQFLRMIDYKANLCSMKGDKKQAEELYKLLLRLNPGDNQGIRYYLAGLYENISRREMSRIFDEENDTQDRSRSENMFLKQNKIHKFFGYGNEEDDEDADEKTGDDGGFSWEID